jgi:UDP-N-acetylmuramoyl-L-alanyl-D-glutamate--2,6-diaminopimelate ligase
MRLLSSLLRAILPDTWSRRLFGAYHLALAYVGAIRWGFPSRKMTVIAVTGTKGKSTVVEIIHAILSEAGCKTASASTIRFCIGRECERNLFKMTMPGRFFLQHFLRRALDAGCTHAVIEMTSEGAVQYRHKGIELDALVFTNLAPEHLESHGGMERYAAAKLSLARHLETSRKRPRIVVANAQDEYGPQFLEARVEERLPFSLREAEPYTADDRGARFFWRGKLLSCPLPGEFNLKNILAALTLCEALGVPFGAMERALSNIRTVPGRAERVERGQPFAVVVDYAHTPDSLRALYQAFGANKGTAEDPSDDTERPAGRRICVLGSTGGGRDTWKRPAMGAIADEHCDIALLTDEDPYDENPRKIIDDVAKGFTRQKPRVVLNRRKAIREALSEAREGDVVLITGKGTDPYIMRARGEKEPWSDKEVAQEELDRLLSKRSRARSGASM